ncbi:lipopolysaccharide biosynthesis protein [Porcipelethomonas sp.]|uniref:lipopolysaccharide biosynthesis protein n=1 Tax=Porcipelethomonas sp. TaxID=2981675 RepID=UPI003EF8554F
MDNEKNISVVLKQQEDSSDEATLSLSTIFRQLRKYLLIWIVLAVVAGMLTVSSVLLFNNNVSVSEITALVSFNYSGIESGLAPDGGKFDVNKIKSPNVIESALIELDEPVSMSENIRRNISIKGIIPDEAMDKISLYQSVYSKGGNAALDAVNALLEIGYYPSYYVINFNYSDAGIDLDDGKKILDEILESYQEYFFRTYGYNESLGNSVVAVDYKDYDYPEAIDVFNTTLDSLTQYVQKLESNDTTNFRSNNTGYSFSDLLSTIDTVKSADLDSLSSYITINNITNDKEMLLTYYQYRIEELERNQNVAEAKLESITNSINEYEKDTLLVFGNGTENSETSYQQASEKYDELINQKIEVQDNVSRCRQRIEYYNDRLDALKNNTSSTSANIENVEERLSNLYDKIQNLIDITNETVDEYYETVTFAHAYNILVPATGDVPQISIGNIAMPLIIIEGVLFVIYLGIVFITSISIDFKTHKENAARKKAQEAADKSENME